MTVLVCFEHHFLQVGQQFYCRQLSPGFLRRYREVWEQVIVFARVARLAEPPAGVPPLETEGIQFTTLPDYVGLVGYLRARRQIQRIAQAALQKADSVLFRAPGIISTAVWKLLRGAGRPYGVEIVGDPHEAFARGAVRHPLRPLIRWKLTRDLRNQCWEAYATGYVTNNTLQKRYPPDPGKFTTAYSDVEIDQSAFADRPREFNPLPSPLRLVMVGTFSQMYKGHDLVLQALAQLNCRGLPLEITFVGDGKHRPEMEQLSRSLGIESFTHFLGEVSAGDPVREQLDRAHLFVMPSRTEGLPRAMIEAMARGLPCIGSAVGGIPELLDRRDLVPPNDVRALADKLDEVLRSPERLNAMSARNLKAAAVYRNEISAAKRRAFYQALRAGTEPWLAQHHFSPGKILAASESITERF